MELEINYSISQKHANYVIIKLNSSIGKIIIGVRSVEIILNKF